MRLFVAVPFSSALKDRLALRLQLLVDKLPAPLADVTWVRPENFHITVKFIGECPEDRVPDLIQAIQEGAGPLQPFHVQIEGLGCFEENGPLHAIWAGVSEGHEALSEWAVQVDSACGRVGFSTEKRFFKPHITLARVKEARKPQAIRAWISQYPLPPFERFWVDSLSLFRSILSASHPTYSPLKVFGIRTIKGAHHDERI